MKKLIIILTLFLVGCNKPINREPVYVEYFKTGDVLLPDYACIDTLIVVDAVRLNKGMGYIEQGLIESTDLEIAKLFYKYCKPKN